MLYIDKIDEKSIRIQTNEKDITVGAVFYASYKIIGDNPIINIHKLNKLTHIAYSDLLENLKVNKVTYSSAEDAVIALNQFIGSFKNGGGASGQTPEGGLSSVTTDETLKGDGTSGNPLGVNTEKLVFVESVSGDAVDNSDPKNPIINIPEASLGGVESVTGNIVDNTDKKNPVVNMPMLDKTIIFATPTNDLHDLVYISSINKIKDTWNPANVGNIDSGGFATVNFLHWYGGNLVMVDSYHNGILNPALDNRIRQGVIGIISYDARLWYNKNIDTYLYAGQYNKFYYSTDNNKTVHIVDVSGLNGGVDSFQAFPYKKGFRILFIGNANSNGKIYDFDPFTETFTDTGVIYAKPTINTQFQYFEDLNVLLGAQDSDLSVYLLDVNNLGVAGTNIANGSIWMTYSSFIRPDWTCRVGDYFYYTFQSGGNFITAINLKTFNTTKIILPTVSNGAHIFSAGGELFYFNPTDFGVYKINRETASYELFWNNPNHYKLFCVVGSGIGNEILVNNNTGFPASSGVSLNDVALKKDLGFQIPAPPSTGVFTLQVTDGVANWIA